MKNALPLTKSPYLLFLFSIILLVSGCNKDDEEAPRPTDSILEVITDTEGLDSLQQLLEISGLEDRLTSGEYTVFAPNNAAFAKLLQSIGLASMSEMNPNFLIDILLYHTVANNIYNVNQLDSVATTLNFEQLTFTQGDSTVINEEDQPNRTVIVTPNLQASNGVIHVVNEVILPESLRRVASYFGTVIGITSTYYYSRDLGGFSTMTNVFNQAQLLPTLRGTGPFTILAPLDGFFNNLAAVELTYDQLANYNILEGNVNLAEADRTINTRGGNPVYVTNNDGQIYLNGIPVYDFGLNANNGRVLLTAGILKPAESFNNIMTVAEIQTGASFHIFRTALRETSLQIGENKTIFIPTDQAFEEAGLVTSIDSAEVARLDPAFLTSILQTHVVNGINFSSDVVAAESVQANALNETPITLTFVPGTGGGGGSITIGSPTTTDARAIFYDELSTQGVVHIINKVLLP